MNEFKTQPFEVPFWARSGHAQTLLGHLLRRPERLPNVKHLNIDLPDGDQLATDYYSGTSNTVVYLFHGLGGNIDAAYMSRVAKSCLDAGHSVYMTNHRGCGRGATLPCRQIYHAGRAEDLSAVIALGRKKDPQKKHIAVGFSLSGNALLLLAAGKRGQVLPDAAVSVNAPLDLKEAAIALAKGLNRIYDLFFVLKLRRELSHKRAKGWVPEDAHISLSKTIYELDVDIAKLPGGLGDRETYYRECSCGQFLSEIKIPTTMITAKDDPFVDSNLYLKARRPAHVELIMKEKGGHMGYIQSKSLFGIHHWLDTEVLNQIQKISRLLVQS